MTRTFARPLYNSVYRQLERPWKAANTQAVEPHGVTWASSQQGNPDFPRVGVKPRSRALACRNWSGKNNGNNRRMRNSASASSQLLSRRRRPSTVPTPSSSGLRRQRSWSSQPPSPLPVDPTWNASDGVGWDDTGTYIRGPRGKPQQAHVGAVHGYGYRPGSPGGEGNEHAELIRNQAVRTVADATLTSLVSSRTFFATSSVVTAGAAEDVGYGEEVDPIHKVSKLVDPLSGHSSNSNHNNNNNGDEEDSYNNKSNVSLGSVDQVGLSVGVGSTAAVKRPCSAGLSTARRASIHPLVLMGDKVIRPQTAGPSSQGRARHPRSASGESRLNERGRAPTSSRPGPEQGACSVTSWTDETPDAGSWLESRTSVSVVLPTLEEGNDTGDKRYSTPREWHANPTENVCWRTLWYDFDSVVCWTRRRQNNSVVASISRYILLLV